jgi:hypothetical protein
MLLAVYSQRQGARLALFNEDAENTRDRGFGPKTGNCTTSSMKRTLKSKQSLPVRKKKDSDDRW